MPEGRGNTAHTALSSLWAVRHSLIGFAQLQPSCGMEVGLNQPFRSLACRDVWQDCLCRLCKAGCLPQVFFSRAPLCSQAVHKAPVVEHARKARVLQVQVA